MLALALALSVCGTGMGPLDRFTDCTLFQSPQEAANFGAHAGWSLALPLLGKEIGGKRGLYIVGGSWLAFSLINEFALHGAESSRERNLNLVSRLAPCALVMLWASLR